jgi:nucleoside 2-deoxyribosyltransferase
MQQGVVASLRAAGIDCYDFRNPPNGSGFGWQEVMPNYVLGSEMADAREYIALLDHPRAIEGFDSDFRAMEKADTFVLVLPCGRSAHLELGWAVGQGKRTAILLDDDAVTPELMYKMVDHISPDLFDLLGWLGVLAAEPDGA